MGRARANSATAKKSIQPREGGAPAWLGAGEGMVDKAERMSGSIRPILQQNRYGKGPANCRRR